MRCFVKSIGLEHSKKNPLKLHEESGVAFLKNFINLAWSREASLFLVSAFDLSDSLLCLNIQILRKHF